MTQLLGLVFDGGLAVLLIVTIGYCAKLSRRIRMLQDNRGELGGMIAQFDQATGRALTTLTELQTVSKRITEALQLKIDKANFLADDLAFLIEKSTKLAAQLEQLKTALPESRPKPAANAFAFPHAGIMPPAKAKAAPAQAPEMRSPITSAASLEALLSRLGAGANADAPPAKPQAPRLPGSPRTDAERELLEALKAGR